MELSLPNFVRWVVRKVWGRKPLWIPECFDFKLVSKNARDYGLRLKQYSGLSKNKKPRTFVELLSPIDVRITETQPDANLFRNHIQCPLFDWHYLYVRVAVRLLEKSKTIKSTCAALILHLYSDCLEPFSIAKHLGRLGKQTPNQAQLSLICTLCRRLGVLFQNASGRFLTYTTHTPVQLREVLDDLYRCIVVWNNSKDTPAEIKMTQLLTFIGEARALASSPVVAELPKLCKKILDMAPVLSATDHLMSLVTK